MRARFFALLPMAVATALSLWVGEAKALIIRYDFDSSSEAVSGYTGGTIDVTSLDQALGAGLVTFTIEINSTIFTISGSFDGGINDLSFSRVVSTDPLRIDSWSARFFDFGSLSSSTTWRTILNQGVFTGSPGTFGWTSAQQFSGEMVPPPSSITFRADVPGPLPALGAAAAFGWSRRLRKRISVCASSRDLPSGSGC